MNKKKAKANRANARRSTGPRTAAGRAVSRLNATAHGLRALTPVIPGEDPAEWDRHLAGVVAALGPAGALEAELAARVALCLWRMRRVSAFETRAAADGLAQAGSSSPVAEELGRLETGVESGRQFQASLDSLDRLARRFSKVRAAAPLDGWEGWHLAAAIAAGAGGRVGDRPKATDPSFLTAMGVPAECHDDPGRWEGWTAGCVRAGARWLATTVGTTADELLARAIRSNRRIADDQRAHLAVAVARLADLRAQDAASRERARGRALLPPADVLDKVMRYEGHLTRQLLHAMNTLERLQRARLGTPGPPPIAVDVNLAAGDE